MPATACPKLMWMSELIAEEGAAKAKADPVRVNSDREVTECTGPRP